MIVIIILSGVIIACLTVDLIFVKREVKELYNRNYKIIEITKRTLDNNEKLMKILNNKEETNNDGELVSEGSVEDCEQTTEC